MESKQIVSGSDDKSVRVWDAVTVTVTSTLQGHLNYVMSVAFSPGGKQIVSGSGDKSVRVWDAVTGTVTSTLLARPFELGDISGIQS